MASRSRDLEALCRQADVLVVAAGRTVVRNSLELTSDGYRMDLADLEAKAADPGIRVMILCNPHNPVGRVWVADELRSVAEICAANDVFVIADEIHADLALGERSFTPFAVAAAGTGVPVSTGGPTNTTRDRRLTAISKIMAGR